MGLEYMVICDQLEEGRTGYGLMVWDGKQLRVFRDLCGRAEPVLDRLCPEHFREVVEDFLAAW